MRNGTPLVPLARRAGAVRDGALRAHETALGHGRDARTLQQGSSLTIASLSLLEHFGFVAALPLRLSYVGTKKGQYDKATVP